jgi:excinuclease ABC subunit C
MDDITGIGPKTKDLLLNHYKSVKKLKEAILSGKGNDIILLIGKSKADLIIKYFTNNERS